MAEHHWDYPEDFDRGAAARIARVPHVSPRAGSGQRQCLLRDPRLRHPAGQEAATVASWGECFNRGSWSTSNPYQFPYQWWRLDGLEGCWCGWSRQVFDTIQFAFVNIYLGLRLFFETIQNLMLMHKLIQKLFDFIERDKTIAHKCSKIMFLLQAQSFGTTEGTHLSRFALPPDVSLCGLLSTSDVGHLRFSRNTYSTL